jgi:uracil-DNA glycosylase
MDLWYGTSGPHNARIVIVGEAWGQDEDAARKPFVGASGRELDRMLEECNILRQECFCTNVISARPYANQIWRFFHPRDEMKGKDTVLGLHPTDEANTHIRRMWEQIHAINPTLIIACGNYALWALTESATISYKSADEKGKMDQGGRLVPSGIMNFRGSMLYSRSTGEKSYPVLPIIHPAAILRQWELRAITIHDLKTRVPKAFTPRVTRDEVAVSAWIAPKMNINIRPSLRDVIEYFHSRISRMDKGEALQCSIDIETMRGDNGFPFITCLSFCTEKNNALTIPLIDKRGGEFVSYWSSPRVEALALQAMRRFLQHPKLRAIGQNFLYDQSYLHDHWGVVPRLSFDTMLAHHLLWPGTPKDLGYLSSIYCSHHRYWKDDNRDWGSRDSPDVHYLYNGEDSIRTFEIAQAQRALIAKLQLDDLWAEEIEKHNLAFELMTRGIRIDNKTRSDLRMKMLAAAEEHKMALLRMFPQPMVDALMEKDKPSKSYWFNSPKQTQFVLNEILQLPVPRSRKSGNLTTDAKAIKTLRDKAPGFHLLFSLLENMRTIGVLTSNVLNAPLERDCRMRCSFNPGGTETFRWSSSENPFGRGTNLQNITPGDD